MKCIYCNSDSDLTFSDIIPAALTGAKLRKKFVCRTHNSFTNEHYEKAMIRQLDIFRNRIGLTERDGDPVRYFATLNIGDYTSEKNICISDNKSIMDADRLFRMKDSQGNTVLVGPKEAVLKISGATEEKVTDLLLDEISISSTMDMRIAFISEATLHAVAKIAYEWHCYINDVEEFQKDSYGAITSYILDPEQTNTLVDIVNDGYVAMLSERFSRTGSNMLFEYNDSDGNTYVIFFLWNVIAYRVNVCTHSAPPSNIHCPIAYFYHADGTQESTLFGVAGDFHVSAISPPAGLSALSQTIKSGLSKLGERDLSREYLKNCIEEISKKLPAYQARKISIAELLDFEHEDRIIPICILEQVYNHRDEYLPSEGFNKNMQRILKADDRYVLTTEALKETLTRYIDMDKKGTFVTMLNDAIAFFQSACRIDQ